MNIVLDKGKVEVNMAKQIQEIIEDFSENIKGKS